MKNFSLTQGGVIVAVIGTLLMKFGFSEMCSNELVTLTPTLVGGLISWIGRWRMGDLKLSGFRK